MVPFGNLWTDEDRGSRIERSTEGGRRHRVGRIRAGEGGLEHGVELRILVRVDENLWDVQSASLVQVLERVGE